MIKQTIYTNYDKTVDSKLKIGFAYLTYSKSVSEELKYELLKYNKYKRPQTNGIEDYPVRYLYHKFDDLYLLSKTTYIGKEHTSMREGNFISHQLIKESSFVNSPISYFSERDIFYNSISKNLFNDNGELVYLDDLLDKHYESNFSLVLEEEDILLFENLYPLILNALFDNNKIIFNNIKDPIKVIQKIFYLIPDKYHNKITFNTFIESNECFDDLQFLNFYDKNNKNVNEKNIYNVNDLIKFDSNVKTKNYYFSNYLYQNNYSKDSLEKVNSVFDQMDVSSLEEYDKVFKIISNNEYTLNDDITEVLELVKVNLTEESYSDVYFNYFELALNSNNLTTLKELKKINYNVFYKNKRNLNNKIFESLYNNDNNFINNLDNLIKNELINIDDLNLLISTIENNSDNEYDNNKLEILLNTLNKNNVNNKSILKIYINDIFSKLSLEQNDNKIISFINNLIEKYNEEILIINFMSKYNFSERVLNYFIEKKYLNAILNNNEQLIINNELILNVDKIQAFYEILVNYKGLIYANKLIINTITDKSIKDYYLENAEKIITDNLFNDIDKANYFKDMFNEISESRHFINLSNAFLNNVDIRVIGKPYIRLLNEMFKIIDNLENRGAANYYNYLIITNKINKVEKVYKMDINSLQLVIETLISSNKIFNKNVLNFFIKNYNDDFTYLLVNKYISINNNIKKLPRFLKVISSLNGNEDDLQKIKVSIISFMVMSDNKKQNIIKSNDLT